MSKKQKNEKPPATVAERMEARRRRLEGAITPKGCGGALNIKHEVWSPHQMPDWEFWLDMPEVKLWQACALSLNVDPDSVVPSNDGMGGESFFKKPSFPNEEIWEVFLKRRRLLKANMQRQNSYDSHPIGLGVFVSLVLSLSSPWDMPQELCSLVKNPVVKTNEPVIEPLLDVVNKVGLHELAGIAKNQKYTSNNEPQETEADNLTKTRRGRPNESLKKTVALQKIILNMCGEEIILRGILPGSAANLLEACQRIEKAKTNKLKVFKTTEQPFKTWIITAGYRFKSGRTPNLEVNYWTKLCIGTIEKIPSNIFT